MTPPSLEVGRPPSVRSARACHFVDRVKGDMVGPNLHGMFERGPAAKAGYGYSNALKALSHAMWTPELIEEWLARPQAFVPGSSMFFNGIENGTDGGISSCSCRLSLGSRRREPRARPSTDARFACCSGGALRYAGVKVALMLSRPPSETPPSAAPQGKLRAVRRSRSAGSLKPRPTSALPAGCRRPWRLPPG